MFNAPAESTAADANPPGPVRATLDNGDPRPRWLRFDTQTKGIRVSALPDRGFPLELVINKGRKVITVMVSQRAAGD